MTEAESRTATERIAVPTAPVPGPSRGRWLIALAVTGVAIGLTIAAVLLLGGRPTPEAVRYVPGDAVVVAELRLDLPGDQLQKVGNLLAHFPGFADQSTLGQKLDESGDRLLGAITNGEVTYTGDLKPWISGPVVAAVRDVEVDPRTGEEASWLFVATTNGAAGCAELFEDRATTTESHRGLEIRVLEGGAGACVEDDRYVVAGDLESVKAGLDAQANGDGIDASERYRAAREALAGDQLATLFVSGEAVERLGDLPGATPGGPGIPGGPTLPFGASLPEWSIMGVRAEDDALVVDSVSAPLPEPSAAPSLQSLAPAHPSELTQYVPADAVAYAEIQGAGTGIVNTLTLLRAEPALAEPLAELDQVLTAFGGAEQLLGWVDDAGVVVMNDGGWDMFGELAGGVLLLAPDEATADARVDTYRSLLALAALGGAAELETTTFDDVEVTTVTVTEAAGLSSGQPVQFRFAVSGRLVVIGTTEEVMRLILGVDRASSLAESDDFARATARALDNPRTMLYVSVGHALAFEGRFLPLDQGEDFRTNVRPYLAPIQAFHMSATEGPEGARARIVMTVTDASEP